MEENSFGIQKLAELPCEISEEGSVVHDTYLKERDEIQTPKELTDFVHRWYAIWELPVPRTNPRSQAEKNLVSETFSPLRVLEGLHNNRGDNTDYHIDQNDDCESHHILMPVALVSAHLVASKYQVPLDVALLQLVRAGELDEEVI